MRVDREPFGKPDLDKRYAQYSFQEPKHTALVLEDQFRGSVLPVNETVKPRDLRVGSMRDYCRAIYRLAGFIEAQDPPPAEFARNSVLTNRILSADDLLYCIIRHKVIPGNTDTFFKGGIIKRDTRLVDLARMFAEDFDPAQGVSPYDRRNLIYRALIASRNNIYNEADKLPQTTEYLSAIFKDHEELRREFREKGYLSGLSARLAREWAEKGTIRGGSGAPLIYDPNIQTWWGIPMRLRVSDAGLSVFSQLNLSFTRGGAGLRAEASVFSLKFGDTRSAFDAETETRAAQLTLFLAEQFVAKYLSSLNTGQLKAKGIFYSQSPVAPPQDCTVVLQSRRFTGDRLEEIPYQFTEESRKEFVHWFYWFGWIMHNIPDDIKQYVDEYKRRQSEGVSGEPGRGNGRVDSEDGAVPVADGKLVQQPLF